MKEKYTYASFDKPTHVNRVLISKVAKGKKDTVESLVPMEGITSISGHPGSGKTWFYFFIAMSVASGYSFLDRFKTTKSRVLIIDEESGAPETVRRVKMLKNSIKDKSIFFLSNQGIKLDSEDCVADLKRCVQENKIGLIIFDPFVSFHNKSENDSGDMQHIMESMAQLNKVGASVIFVHHHRKDSVGKTSQSIRGSSAVSGRVDSHLSVEKVSDGEEIKMIIRQEKMRRGKRIDPFEICIYEAEGQMNISYKGEKEIEKMKKDNSKDKILKILEKDKQLDFKDISTEINKDFQVGDRNIFNALQELEKEMKIKSSKNGKKKIYFLNSENIQDPYDLFTGLIR